MHAIAFGAKRVFHSFLRVMRKPMRLWPGLTGARFDMMSAFLEGDDKRPVLVRLRQSQLRRKLGVCASVVSRIVRALEKLGWMERWPHILDRRTWLLALTARGEQVIREARRLLLRPAERLMDDALHQLSSRQGRVGRWERLGKADGPLVLVRVHLGDPATLDYPWWPTPYDG
jgi:DNA-binding MarR family transcriptional regulator